MIKRIKSDRIVIDEDAISGYVYIDGKRITAVGKEELPYDIEIDKTRQYVAPGFIDLHTHGGLGHEFFGSAEDIIEGCNFHLLHGTTSICPTISAAPFSIMAESVVSARQALQSERIKSNFLGLHFEGPYLSTKQCGAQCPDFITAPIPEQYERFIQNTGSLIRRWTFAPENDQDNAFCKYLTEHHILASAGHTDATGKDMDGAMQCGCRLVTHLYSCTSTVTRDHGFRRLGVIEHNFLHDEMYAEIIADGKHLPPDLIRMILKIKGNDHVILCTDSLALAGTEVTSGKTLGTEFIIEDGVCKLKDRSAFAGSIATADKMISVMTKDVGLSVPAAVKLMTDNPARLLGLRKGRICPGFDADIVIFDDNIQIQSIFVMGKEISWQ